MPPRTLARTHVVSVHAPVAVLEHDDEDDDYDDDEDDGEDEAGSLCDFVVEDVGGEDGGDIANEADVNDECVQDAAGIDVANIITGRRQRRPTKTYESELFATQAYKDMMLCDVPDDEMHALEGDSGDEECGQESDCDVHYDTDESSESGDGSDTTSDSPEHADEKTSEKTVATTRPTKRSTVRAGRE